MITTVRQKWHDTLLYGTADKKYPLNNKLLIMKIIAKVIYYFITYGP